LQLKGKDFKIFTPATDEEMDKCWNSIKELDPEITPSVTPRQLYQIILLYSSSLTTAAGNVITPLK